jgi:oxygen-independent coproporphyrinogen-3 oxidase
MNALRLVDGVDAGLLMERTGQPLDRLDASLRKIRQRGWMTDLPDRLQATPEGMQSLNRVLAMV